MTETENKVKKFILCSKRSLMTPQNEELYRTSIVFIQDTGEIYTQGQYFSTSIKDVEKIEDLKVKLEEILEILPNKADSVSGSDSISVIKTGNDYQVGLRISENNKGNVDLEITEDGLKASVDITEVSGGIKGVSAKDDILYLNKRTGTVSSGLALNYNSINSRLELLGKDGEVFSFVDASEFNDSFVKVAELFTEAEAGVNQEVPYLKLTFSDDKEPIRISVKDLVDVYDGSNLLLSKSFKVADNYSDPKIGDSMDTVIGKLVAKADTDDWLEL